MLVETALMIFETERMKPIYRSAERPDISKVLPDRGIFKNRNYLPVGLVEASRGCTFRCEFLFDPELLPVLAELA